MNADSAPRELVEFAKHIEQLFADVDEQAFERHEAGAEKYGAFKFLGADSLEEALEEVLDLINYARYTAVKIKILQEVLSREASALMGSDTTGGAFIPTSDLLKG